MNGQACKIFFFVNKKFIVLINAIVYFVLRNEAFKFIKNIHC